MCVQRQNDPQTHSINDSEYNSHFPVVIFISNYHHQQMSMIITIHKRHFLALSLTKSILEAILMQHKVQLTEIVPMARLMNGFSAQQKLSHFDPSG